MHAVAVAMNAKPIRVLLIEDNPGDAGLVRAALAASVEPPFELTVAGTLAGGLDRIAAAPTDVVLLDLGLPDARGFEGLHRLRANAPALPVVALTGGAPGPYADTAVTYGAQDFLFKNTMRPDTLARTLRYAIDRQHVLARMHQARRRLQTDLEAAEAAWREARRAADRLHRLDSTRSEFVAQLCHDLRSPLSVVASFTAALLARADDDDRRWRLAVMSRNLEEMNLLIEEILDAAAIESGTLRLRIRPTDLATIVGRTATEVAAAADRHIDLDIPADCPRARADRLRQEQILANLLGNAFKFSAADTPVAVTVTVEAELLRVRVTDHGIGIPEPEIPGLFGKYHRIVSEDTNRSAGTGLGLYICKQLVEAQGGTVGIRSRAGQGTTVDYTVPISHDDTPGQSGAR
ncbi:ATP-binding response regulator [Nocardia seriolae]|nr:ATP-binding protein [Nocardia seriolae]MTJ65758.1 response regulator [Nocardia seriolae]MTJ75135.1 response regulator [Nocardia seriolae]MTJ86309.1 response regulator [Nocardia seriolae]MTK30305.1 response regulator [Nocardia seriolae]MTK43756.1 response regulator [Nocardia seriolae]